MTYDPNLMPASLEEWNELVDYYFNKDQQRYEQEVAKAKAAAEKQFNEMPDDENRPTLEQFVTQAVASVSPAATRGQIEQTYAVYYPHEQTVPETPPPTTEQLFWQLRALREVRLKEYDTRIAQLERRSRLGEDVAARLSAWDAYALELCNLPAQEGAPWDGGGSQTPWPAVPA